MPSLGFLLGPIWVAHFVNPMLFLCAMCLLDPVHVAMPLTLASDIAAAAPGAAREAVARGAKVLWMQLGVVSEEGAQIAEAAGIVGVLSHNPLVAPFGWFSSP